MNHRIRLALASAVVAACLPAASFAASVYTTESAFDAAAGAVSLTTQSFEGSPSSSTSTSRTYGDVTFSCVGNTYCPSFFGSSTVYATDGTHSVFGATPDALVFTFAAPITDFAVDLIGLADVGATNLTVTLSNGYNDVVFANLSQAGGARNFVSVIDAGGFTSVTFTGSKAGDGIFFDRLQYGVSSVPEPGMGLLMGMGLLAAGVASRRRKG